MLATATNMTHALPNFSRSQEATAAAESFYENVAHICEVNGRRAYAARERHFLHHAALRAQQLADALRAHREARQDAVMQTWMQYAPDGPLPGERELWMLHSQGGMAESTLFVLQRSAARWSAIYRRLAASSRTDAARDVHESCAELLECWNRHLNQAYLQIQDY
ncbi:MAG: hypothetical protein PVI30_04985 [Myxococcales bacterium]